MGACVHSKEGILQQWWLSILFIYKYVKGLTKIYVHVDEAHNHLKRKFVMKDFIRFFLGYTM
jgi:hypothetical protein